jgi:hypothetical protein
MGQEDRQRHNQEASVALEHPLPVPLDPQRREALVLHRPLEHLLPLPLVLLLHPPLVHRLPRPLVLLPHRPLEALVLLRRHREVSLDQHHHQHPLPLVLQLHHRVSFGSTPASGGGLFGMSPGAYIQKFHI